MACSDNSGSEAKERFNEFCENVSSNIAVDYSNREIQDIQEAVLEMLTRTKDNVNKRGVFKIDRKQPAGSMAEKTALITSKSFLFLKEDLHTETWHLHTETWPYLEFDFLAVLEKPDNLMTESQNCEGCLCVSGDVWDKELATRYGHYRKHHELYGTNYVPLHSDDIIRANFADDIFVNELRQSLVSDCRCFSCSFTLTCPGPMFHPSSAADQTGCERCCVTKRTGKLHISDSHIPWENCSLMFMWTSNEMSLKDLDGNTLENRQLLILIDFLPALEIFKTQINVKQSEHECFLVPKKCNACWAYTWRISNCLAEIDTIVNKMSNKHKRCYLVLKCICKYDNCSPDRLLNSYHVKTIVLYHAVTCTDTSEDCYRCVIEILEELRKAYRTRVLIAFGLTVNLFSDPDKNKFLKDSEKSVDKLLKTVLQFES